MVRHHVVLGEAISAETLSKGGHRNSLLGPAHWLVFYNHSGQVCRDWAGLGPPFSQELPTQEHLASAPGIILGKPGPGASP